MPPQAHYADNRIVIRKLLVGRGNNGVYIIVDPRTNQSVIIDCADEAGQILDAVSDTRVIGIWETHGDSDHLRALDEVRAKLGVPVSMHRGDSSALTAPPDVFLEDGDVLAIGDISFKVLHTPGHTIGGVCFQTDGHLFSGDTLFPGGPGATKREGGDFPLIIKMITEKLFVLPDETRVYPGHGNDTTIGTERPHLQEWIDRGW